MNEFVSPFLRSGFNYDTNVVSDETGVDCSREACPADQKFAVLNSRLAMSMISSLLWTSLLIMVLALNHLFL